jgi:hypothetical protein
MSDAQLQTADSAVLHTVAESYAFVKHPDAGVKLDIHS